MSDADDQGAPPPRLFRRPADARPPLGHLGDSAVIEELRRVAASELGPLPPLTLRSLRARLRVRTGRLSGRSDRRLLAALAAATDAVVRHVDEVVDRLHEQESIGADTSRALGEDVTRLRIEVMQLRDAVTTRDAPRRG